MLLYIYSISLSAAKLSNIQFRVFTKALTSGFCSPKYDFTWHTLKAFVVQSLLKFIVIFKVLYDTWK